MFADTDPNLKFFSAPGKVKLKPILKKVKTNTIMKGILVNSKYLYIFNIVAVRNSIKEIKNFEKY